MGLARNPKVQSPFLPCAFKHLLLLDVFLSHGLCSLFHDTREDDTYNAILIGKMVREVSCPTRDQDSMYQHKCQ